MFRRFNFSAIVASTILCVIAITADAQEPAILSKGQTVYVPVYSHIYTGNRERPFNLAVTLSIRNTDPATKITIEAVDYYDSAGKLIKRYLENPTPLNQMASIRYVVKEQDKSGGSGANFIVKWKAVQKVNAPIIEAVMIGAQSQQGISFTSRGQVLK
jgi:hypothetical protein